MRPTEALELKKAEWVEKHKSNNSVLNWLIQNPPPPEWEAGAMEWAFLEMPSWLIHPNS